MTLHSIWQCKPLAAFSMLDPEESLWDTPFFKITFEFHFDEVLIG